jgi:hypothetical protein
MSDHSSSSSSSSSSGGEGKSRGRGGRRGDYRDGSRGEDRSEGRRGGRSGGGSSPAQALTVAHEAIRKSEELQMQGNPSAAVAEVLAGMERLRGMGRGDGTEGWRGWRGFALCQRRLGVLYKAMGRYDEAEESVRQFIAHLEDTGTGTGTGAGTGADTGAREEEGQGADAQHLAVAHTLLSSILDGGGGRSVEARQSDARAAQLMAEGRGSPYKSPRLLI